MEQEYHGEGIVSGYIDGVKFRPSAWSEMLAECAAVYHPEKKFLEYSEYARPIYHERYGHCIEVDFDALKQTNPLAYRQISWFIDSNHMQVFHLDGSPLLHEPVVHDQVA